MALGLHNAVVQTIHLLDRRPLHLQAHLAIACDAFARLYGGGSAVDIAQIRHRIAQRLAEAGYPARGSALVRLSLMPRWGIDFSAPPEAEIEIECCGRLLYPGYAAWHGRLRATVTPYDSFPAGEPCLSNLLNASYAESYARMQGFDAAVRVSGGLVTGLAGGVWCCGVDGAATRGGAGEYPLFFVREGGVATPSLESGAQDSVPRRLMIGALSRMGMEVSQCDIPETQLGDFDEAFAATPQGAVGLRSCDNSLFLTILVDKAAAVLPGLTAESLMG